MKVVKLTVLAAGPFLQLVSAAPVCGDRGYDNGVDSYYDDNQGTYNNCSAACQKSSKCKSFAYGNGECYLYGVSVGGNFEADKSSPYMFYDASCSRSSVTTTTTKSSTLTTSPSKTTTNSIKTTPSTLTTTTTTTTTSKSSTTSVKPSSSCAVDNRTKCTGQNLSDPCNQGCGCVYVEGCGGSIRPSTTEQNSVLASYNGVSYSFCVKQCDANQPACIGVNFAPGGPVAPGTYVGTDSTNGSCYLMNATAGTGPNPGGWFAYRDSCSKSCPRL